MTFRPTLPATFQPRLQPLRAARSLGLPLALATLAMSSHAAVIISQVYGGGGNGGAPFTNDFVELRNTGKAAVNLSGWSVQYASTAGTSWSNRVNLTGSIPANSFYLVQLATGGANGAALPTADATGNINMSATNGKLALSSSITELTGSCPLGGAVVDFVGFGTANCSEGNVAAPAGSNSTALFRAAGTSGNACADTDNNGADFTSATPLPRNSSTSGVSCGSTGGGGGGGTPVAAAIYTIQGSGASSPMVGQLVVTSGVVTKLLNNGFFIQDAAGDGNPATSDGVFVFTSAAPPATAQVGSLVEVTGSVVEFSSGAGTAAMPLTEIGSVTSVNLLGSGSITPTVVNLPLAPGESLERYEGMLVSISGALTVQQNFYQARYGQLTLGAGGRHETPTNRFRPGAQAQALADQQARGRLLLDDSSSLQNPGPTPYLMAGGVPRAGDTVSNLVGVLDFGLATSTASGPGLFRLQPTAAPVFSVGNARPAAPTSPGGNVKLGSMNVLNFFTTFTNGQTATGQTGQGCSLGGGVSAGNCRGANDLNEFMRQRSKIVLALAGLNADAVGLMEIQNNGNVAAQNLIDALNAVVGAGTYAAVPTPAQGTGTDAIRVAMIYKPAKLSLFGASTSDPAAINNRPTLAQSFSAANGEKFTLVVNHLKSKGSCPGAGDSDAAGNLDTGDGQGCWNLQRVQQAQQLRTFVAQLQNNSGSNDVLLVGDFNAYGQEDPIFELTGNGYIDQAVRYTANAYSYVFDGTAGRLDHAITTAALSPKIVGTTHWHINADEQTSYDYNVEFKFPATTCGPACPPDPFNGNDPFRSSDHDPVLVGLNLYKIVNGSAGADVLVGSAGDDMITGGPGADKLTGGAGADLFVYQSALDGGDTITDFQPGVDKIVLRDLLRSLGRSAINSPIALGYVTCASARGGALLGIDTDGSAGPLPSRPLALLQGQNCATVMTAQNFVF